MQVLTLQRQLDPKCERVCLQCGKIFRKKTYVSERAWEEKHKLCSRECVGWSGNRGIRLAYNHLWRFQCCICGFEVIGKKKDLKAHKQQHAY